MPDAKQKYTVSGGNIKFNGKWYKPHDTIELTANLKKQIMETNPHINVGAKNFSPLTGR